MPAQELLLKAALLHGDAARDAVTAWRRAVRLDNLDKGSLRLLPLLAGKFAEADSELDAKAREFFDQALERQHEFDRVAADVGRMLGRAGIRPVLLKGMALVARRWVQPGQRAMADCDVLVRHADALRVRDLFTSAGWVVDTRLNGRLLAVRHAVPVTSPSGASIDLHWHVMPECCGPGVDDEWLESSRPAYVEDVEMRTLSATDMLLHVCVHGLSWSRLPPFRWVADAMAVLRNPDEAIDWNRLVSHAKARTLSLPASHALRYLHETFDEAVPEWVVPALDAMPLPSWAEAEYLVKQQPRTISRQLRFHWLTHRRLENSNSLTADLWTLPAYIRARWTRTRPRTTT